MIGTKERQEKVGLVEVAKSISPFHRTKLVFMAAAFAALVLAVVVWFTVDREQGIFIGLWVPAIHSLGTLVLTGEGERRDE